MKLFKPVLTGAMMLGAMSWASVAQAAASEGCNYINALSSNIHPNEETDTFYQNLGSKSYTEGEVITIKWINSTLHSIAPTANAIDTSNGNAKLDTDSAMGVAGGNVILKLTISKTTTASVSTSLDGESSDSTANYIIQFSCGQVSDNSSNTGSPSTETTSKAVTSAVARSQTTVIQQNIGARAATVIGSAGAGGVGTGSSGGTGGTGSTGSAGTSSGPVADDDGSSFAQSGFADSLGALNTSDSDTGDVMRRLAMTSSFDSSVMAVDFARKSALALGPTDQGNTGGASGIDGRSALASASPITVWGHGSYTSVDNDYNNGTQDNRYDGDVWGYNIGADYRFDNNIVAGLSLGYNDTDLTTTFNDGTYQENAWVISPYAIISPTENLSIVTEAGYSQGNIDVTRNNDAVNGSTDSAMWYASLKGIYAYRPMQDTPLTLSPSVSLLAARKTIDSYTESDGTFNDSSRSNTRQFKPAIEAAYDFGFDSLTVTPFVETGMVHDFTDELNNDKTAFTVGGGVRLSDRDTGLNAALEGSYLAGRTDYTEYTVAGTVSYGFELRDLDGQPVGLMSPFFGSDVDEYGNQSMSGGLGFISGPMTSRLSLAHDISQAGSAESRAQISMSLDF
ncbi:autotransporter outer membrane beta-barrel domain-containing protein [Thalassospira alkalitolerans]